MVFAADELDAVVHRFTWDSPLGLTPTDAGFPQGFAIVAAGTVLDPLATDKRTLFFVSTATSPWTVQASTSK